MNYTKYQKGSEWGKWDLHVHTPSSNNCYKDKTMTNETIINKLEENKISLAAITDHHIIDIKRIEKLQELGAKKNITILPGIEFKAEMRGSEPIHYIGIFSEKADLKYIWGEINSKANIATQKAEGKRDEEIYCDLKDTCILIKELGGLVSIHAGVKSNSIEVITNSLPVTMAQKRDIVENVDILELGKPEDAKGYREKVFKEVGIFPMIICSDNHDAKNYTLKETCWIKANPTFEGLRQIIYEPEYRVRIQSQIPEDKKPYSVIDAVRFLDNRTKKKFDDKWIELNPNLNSIIGGKSSGKSLLLYHIAKTIDSERIDSINSEKGTFKKIEYLFEEDAGFSFEVKWADGITYKLKDEEKPNRPITYIPQLYLNRLAEDQKDELNSLVDKMLIDSSLEYKEFRNNTKRELDNVKTEMFQVIDDYYKSKESFDEKEKELKEFGDKKAISENLKQIKEKIEKLRKESSFTEDEEKQYKELTENIKELKQQESDSITLIEVLEALKVKLELFKKGLNDRLMEAIFPDLDYKFPTLAKEITDKVTKIIDNIVPKLKITFADEINKFPQTIIDENKNLEQLKEKTRKATEKLTPLAEKVKNKTVFAQLQKEQEDEAVKLKTINDKQVEIEKLKKELITDSIKSKYGQLFKCHQDIVEQNSKYESIPDTEDLKLSSIIKIDKDKFAENFVLKINKKRSLNQQFGECFDQENNYVFVSENHLTNINMMIDKITSGKISLKTGFDEKHTILSLLDDYFFIDYNLLQERYNQK